MALTESRLRQIIKEEAKKMMEMERTPRGLPTRRGEPRDMDTTRDVAYGRGDRGVRFGQAMGGRDEGDDEGDDDYGRPAHWDFNRSGGLRKGDRVKFGGGLGTVVYADEVSSHVKVEKPDGTVVDADGDYLKRA